MSTKTSCADCAKTSKMMGQLQWNKLTRSNGDAGTQGPKKRNRNWTETLYEKKWSGAFNGGETALFGVWRIRGLGGSVDYS